jgi:hypothetical protein
MEDHSDNIQSSRFLTSITSSMNTLRKRTFITLNGKPSSTSNEEITVKQESNSVEMSSTRSWRSRILPHFNLFSKLPKYTGPYQVSCHDIEWFGGSGREHRGSSMTSAETATHSEDADKERAGEKEPLLVRLYYPAEPTGNEHQATWLPPPAYVYGQGKR